jgi:hypothetical protein
MASSSGWSASQYRAADHAEAMSFGEEAVVIWVMSSVRSIALRLFLIGGRFPKNRALLHTLFIRSASQPHI